MRVVRGAPGTRIRSSRLIISILVGALLVWALWLRLDHLTDPPLGFWPVRQYRSALIARGLYYEIDQKVPEPLRRVARENLREQGVLEPPIVESVAAAGYVLAGKEQLWIARLISVSYWLAAGLALCSLVRRLGSTPAAVVATTYFLFARYGVAMSRSIQPDVLMMLGSVVALRAIVMHWQQPTGRRWWTAVALAALAGFIKPPALFFVVPAGVALAVSRRGAGDAVRARDRWPFVGLVCAPAALYSLLGIFAWRFLQGQAALSFQPALVATPAFWAGWLAQIDIVAGRRLVIVSLLALAVAPASWRRLLAAQWLGYMLLGLVFTYHMHTHAYYHTPLILVVGLSLAALTDGVLLRTRGALRPAAVTVAVAISLVYAARATVTHRWSVEAESWNFSHVVSMFEEIGSLTGHSASVVVIEEWPNLPLRYHAHVAGIGWVAAGAGHNMTPAQRFREWYLPRSPSHVIVLDMGRLKRDTALRDFLYGSFPVISDSREYVVFEVNRTGAAEEPRRAQNSSRRDD